MQSFLALAALAALATALPHAHNHLPLHARLELGSSLIAGRSDATALSPVGVCGGDSGFTCGSGFCCSQWGYCGQSTDYCGVGCQFGACDGSKVVPTGSGSAANSTGSLLPSATLGSDDVLTSTVFNVAQVTEYQTVTGYAPHAHGPPGSSSAWSSPAETQASEAPAPSTPATTAQPLTSSVPAPPAYTAPAPTTTLTTVYSTPVSSSIVSTPSSTYVAPSSSVWASSSASSSSTTSAAPSYSTESSSSGGLGDTYTMYNGDGTEAEGWPAESKWMDFDSLWQTNMQYISISCINSFNVPNNSDDESSELKAAISSVASSTGIDPRFILAIVMQESKGCVRAPTTSYSVRNPGLMQSHDGSGTCNDSGNGGVQNPCPQSEIQQMINDGTAGVQGAYGLKQNLQQTSASDVSQFYKAARIYNSGSIPSSGDLGAAGATRCYASDIANRLTGWVTAPHGCTLS